MSLLIALAVLVSPAIRRRSLANPESDPAAEYEAIAAELRRGASLRHAIAATFPGSHLARLAVSGQPTSWVVAELESQSSADDPLAGVGVRLAATSGASAAPLFIALAERVRTQRDIATKKRVLTAQAKVSAVVIAILPLVVGLVLVASRSLGVLATSSAARNAVVVGITMQIVGAAAVALMVRQAGR